MSAISSCHDGKLGGGGTGMRMRGSGPLAQVIADQFRLHSARHGLNDGWPELSTAAFRSPHGRQQSIFDFLGADGS